FGSAFGNFLGNGFNFGLPIAQLLRGLGVEAFVGGRIPGGLSNVAFGGRGPFQSFGGAGQLANLYSRLFALCVVQGGLDFGGSPFDRPIGTLQELFLGPVSGFIGTFFERLRGRRSGLLGRGQARGNGFGQLPVVIHFRESLGHFVFVPARCCRVVGSRPIDFGLLLSDAVDIGPRL